MKKIMISLPSLGGGGAEKNAVMIANYLVDFHEVHIVCCYSNDGNKNIDVIDERVRVTFLDVKKITVALPRLALIIHKNKPDVVITTVAYFSLAFSLIIPFLPKGIKFICRETNIPEVYGQQKSLFYRTISSIIYSFFYGNYDILICQSNDMLDSMRRITKMDESKLVKINNPAFIYNNDFTMVDLPLPCSNGYLIAAGRLTYQKGFDLLIEEYKSSEFFNSGIPLFIAGDGPDFEKIQGLIDRLDLGENVYLLGFRNDIATLIYHSSAFVLSSRYEGFPNVVLESLVLGCPVIARNCPGGLTEVIREPINGFLYDDNFNEISARFISTDFDRNIIKDDVTKRFSQEYILSKYLKLM